MSDTAAPAPAAPSAPSSSPAPSSAPSSSAAPSAPADNSVVTAAGTKMPFDAPAPTGQTPAENNHPDAKPGETKAETIQRIKLKTKVNGKEIEREFDETELQLYVQKGMGADEKFQQAAKVQKTFAEFQKAVKENPFEALKDPAFGLDLEELAIQHLAKKFEAEEKQKANPQQYELEQYKAKVAAWEAKEAAAKEAQQKAAAEESDRRLWEETEKSWIGALEKSGFGANKAYIRQMAEIGRDFLDAGLDLNPELIVAEMKNRMAASQKMLFGGLKGKDLAAALGDDLVRELLAHKVAELKASKPVQEPIKPPEAPPAANTSKNDANDDRNAALKAMFSFR